MHIVAEGDGTKLKYSYGEVELYKLPPKASGDIVIPQRVTSIRKRKIIGKNITSITLQGKVKKIADGRCFFNGNIADNCPNLKVYTPAGTLTEADAKAYAIPYETI